MEKNEPGNRINDYIAEFRDEKLENEYRQAGFYRLRTKARPLLGLLAGLYAAVMAFDLFLSPIQLRSPLPFILLVLFIAASLLVILRIPSITEYKSLASVITAYEFLSISIYYYLLGNSQQAYTFSNVGLGVLTICLLLFLIPNRWVHSFILSVLTLSAFFAFFQPEGRDAEPLNRIFGCLFTLFAVLLMAAFTNRTGIEQRMHFQDNRKLLRLSFTDPLTGIANRGRFNEALQSWVTCANDYKVPLSLVLFDFDDFKTINDSYGHLIGDQVILQTVNLVDEAIRRRDLFARWGGEEFTLLFPDTRLDEALEIVERLRHTIETNHYIRCGHVTASFGVAQYHPGESPDTLMDRADRLLYRAKADGKNCIRSAG